jgi:hypothetical protein
MPVDVEGHLGLDNRFYVIDTARCMCVTLCNLVDSNECAISISTSDASKRVC